MRSILLSLPLTLFSLPVGPAIQMGDVGLHLDGKIATIQTGDFAEIHWDAFSIETDEWVRFLQPDANSIAINKVLLTEPSRLFGKLESVGQIVLLNPNGILVGKDAMIDVGSLIASSLDVLNVGTIKARSGKVQITSSNLVNRGSIFAPKIILEAPGAALAHYGELISPGGEIHLLGGANHIHSGSVIDVSAPTGGGTILIGGDYKGQNPDVPNSRHTWIDTGASILANAIENGDGGKIVFWGDESNYFRGAVESRGGLNGGNGGFIEISSKGYLDASGQVSTSAPFGKSGELFLDPCAVTIAAAANSGISTFPPPGYTFTGAAANISTMSPMTLVQFLAASDVTIDASASGTAGVGSITVSDGVVWGSGNKLTLIADGFIQIDDGLISSAPGLAGTTPIIEVSAPIVQVGPAAAIAQVFAFSGQIIVNAPTSLSIFSSGPPMPMTRHGIQTGALGDAGTVVIDTGELLLSATVTSTVIDSSLGNDISVSGNIQLLAGNGADDAQAQIACFMGGDNVVMAGGNLTMTSGSGSGASLNTIIGSFGGGTLSVAIGGDIAMQAGGGTTPDGASVIGLLGGAGSCNVSARNISITSGTGTGNCVALIGNGLTGTGPTTVNATGSQGITINAMGDHVAVIGSILGGTDDVTINTTHLNLNGSTTAGAVGGSAQVITLNGDILVNATGDITQIGGGGSSNNSANIEADNGSITIFAENINLFAGTAGASTNCEAEVVSMNGGDITIVATGNINSVGGGGTSNNIAGIINQSPGGAINVRANNVNLFGGTGSASNSIIHARFGPLTSIISGDYFFQSNVGPTGIGAATVGGSGDLIVSGRNYTMIAGGSPFSATGCATGRPIGPVGGNGSLFFTATGSVVMMGGGANSALATISTNGTGASNALNMEIYSNLTLIGGSGAQANIFTRGGPISIRARNDITMMSNTFDAAVFITAGSSNLFMEAGRNMSVNSTIQHLGSGDITLVVDANFPQPFIGPGSFSLGPSSTLTTTLGALRIFTSQQQLNSILGTLNGLAFTPGALFVDTNKEVWCVYSPSAIGGTPFTVFYKECLQLLAYQAEVIAVESLERFQPYDLYPGWWERFSFMSEPYFITKRHSAAFWLPKDYTTLLHDEL